MENDNLWAAPSLPKSITYGEIREIFILVFSESHVGAILTYM